jgi:NADH-quinone oxidoreductase subunit N
LASEAAMKYIVLAVVSLADGNLGAIAQTNLKRMLAYSTIGQIGFVLLGLASGVVYGNTLSAGSSYSAAMFYMVTYVVTTLGTFGMILLMARKGFEAEEISDLSGLNQRSPLLAAVMAAFMLSLTGLPPLVGFYAKFAVLRALVSTNVEGYVWLAVFAVLMSLVGAFYYLRVVKVMYFDDAGDRGTIETGTAGGVVLSLNGAAVLLLGLLPGGLMAMCVQAVVKALAT